MQRVAVRRRDSAGGGGEREEGLDEHDKQQRASEHVSERVSGCCTVLLHAIAHRSNSRKGSRTCSMMRTPRDKRRYVEQWSVGCRCCNGNARLQLPFEAVSRSARRGVAAQEQSGQRNHPHWIRPEHCLIARLSAEPLFFCLDCDGAKTSQRQCETDAFACFVGRVCAVCNARVRGRVAQEDAPRLSLSARCHCRAPFAGPTVTPAHSLTAMIPSTATANSIPSFSLSRCARPASSSPHRHALESMFDFLSFDELDRR